jgi:predicted RND superfamily exporter protein
MRLGLTIIETAMNRPKLLSGVIALVCAVLITLVALPSFAPQAFPMLAPVRVDTDPENMLSHDEPVRVFHQAMKAQFELYDIVVVGVANEAHPHRAFNAETQAEVHALTEFAQTLRWELPATGEMAGVVPRDILAPSVVDNIAQGGPGVVTFEWLMPEPPKTDDEALAVRDKALALPFFKGTLVSEDGQMLALYIPITSKDQSYRVATALQAKISEFAGDTQYYITGLPVANDTFGVEMFVQMAISAPLAMLAIFLLMLVFFRKLILIVSPMIIAMASVIITMGALVITGNTIHIMSSMIPIFIMPIAVLDSIHILSEFFDHYQQTKDRRKTLHAVMQNLFTPMLYTSLTSAAGFASLALTPIPPVQTFGLFVALGILSAWILTILFIPAYIMMIPERRLENFGAPAHDVDAEEAHPTLIGRLLHFTGTITYRWHKLILLGAVGVVVFSVYGISKINVNDNPTRWFKASHPIRVADKVLNDHFGGTYMAYLALRPGEGESLETYLAGFHTRLDAWAAENAEFSPEIANTAAALRTQSAEDAASQAEFLEALTAYAGAQIDASEGDLRYAWEDTRSFLELEQQRNELFKQPEALRYIENLQQALAATGTVGKSNSVADLVKTVHRELFEGDAAQFRVPDSARAVAQCYLTFESSHRPQDLYHFVTPDYTEASLWVQLTSGDNKDMSRVVAALEDYIAENPPPFDLQHEWFGLTYINVVWQEKMVYGMLNAFAGSFVIVLLMMIVLFRSILWGLLSMIPLTITVGFIYGVIGLVGKDYDMPVAVLSSLSLGLAVDFAIHFLARSREIHARLGTWEATQKKMFGEPARAITRNVLVIAIGFLPLLAAPLMPYVTVGFFLAAILFVSGGATLKILPALITVFEPWLFRGEKRAVE